MVAWTITGEDVRRAEVTFWTKAAGQLPVLRDKKVHAARERIARNRYNRPSVLDATVSQIAREFEERA